MVSDHPETSVCNDIRLWALSFIVSEDLGLHFGVWIHIWHKHRFLASALLHYENMSCNGGHSLFLIGKDLLVDGVPDQDSLWMGKKWVRQLCMWAVGQSKFQHLATPENGKLVRSRIFNQFRLKNRGMHVWWVKGKYRIVWSLILSSLGA